MKVIKGHKPETCVNCPVWLPIEQTGAPDSEKIRYCIWHVLSQEGLCLTGEEFLAQVEANRTGRVPSAQKAIDPTTPEVIEYFLKPNVVFYAAKNVATAKEATL
jgi:hypothetical protein